MPDTPPRPPIHVILLVCEKVLTEVDGVNSAIRIADVFYQHLIEQIPIEQQAVPVYILTSVRLSPDDSTEHTLQLRLTRPNGESLAMGEPVKAVAEAKIPGAPRGFDVRGPVGIIAKQEGTYYISLLMDGEEIARAPITIRREEPSAGKLPMPTPSQ